MISHFFPLLSGTHWQKAVVLRRLWVENWHHLRFWRIRPREPTQNATLIAFASILLWAPICSSLYLYCVSNRKPIRNCLKLWVSPCFASSPATVPGSTPRCPAARRRWVLRQAYEVAATAGGVHSRGFNQRWLKRIRSDWTC